VGGLIAALASRSGARAASRPGLTAAEAEALCRELAAEFRAGGGPAAEGLDDLPDRLRAEGLAADEVVRQLLRGTPDTAADLARRLKVDAGAFAVFATYWVRPFAPRVVEGGTTPGGSSTGVCPTCGAAPALGRLRRPDGARWLWCARCGADWRAPVLQCPFCGNDEPGTLGYFEVEGEARIRVETCSRCRGYLKVVDERQTDPFVPTDYDRYYWSSALYDLLAEDRGWGEGMPSCRKEKGR